MVLMFDYLKKFKNIVVTGPQRSGTRITTNMIAKDLGYDIVDELDYKDIFKLFDDTPKVIHAPMKAYECHTFPKEVAVVFMIRDTKDILKSQKRITWGCNHVEVKSYIPLKEHYNNKLTNSCDIKYEVWNNYQKKNITNKFEVKYKDLTKHPLYIPKKDRSGFSWNEIEPK
jgi:hypothetical protein